MKQTFLLIVLALGMCSASLAQVEKKYRIEEDGFEWYRIEEGSYPNKKYGAEDKNGKVLVPCQYSFVYYHSAEHYVRLPYFSCDIENSSKRVVGVYSIDGKCLIPTSRNYTSLYGWEGAFIDHFTVEREGIGKGVCDVNGRELIFVNDIEYISPGYSNGKFFYDFKKNGLMGLMDGNGKIIIEPKYKRIYSITSMYDEYIEGENENGERIKIAPSSIVTTTQNLLGKYEKPSSSSSSSQQTYVFEFDSYILANTDIKDKMSISISRSGDFFVDYGGLQLKYKCTSIEYHEAENPFVLFDYSYITFREEGKDELTITSSGVFLFSYITTPINDTARNAFVSILKEVKNKTFMPSVKNTKRIE